MPDIAEKSPVVSPLLIAGLLLAARGHLRQLDLPCPSVDAILAATSAGRARAYEYMKVILELLPSLSRPPGRPPAAPPTPPPLETQAIRLDVLRFIIAHPGCVHGGPERRRYGDVFRRFVLELRREHRDVPKVAFSEAIDVPLGTVEEWLADAPDEDEPVVDEQEKTSETDRAVAAKRVESILAAWAKWHGDFSDFCKHAQDSLRIPYGRTFIADLLEAEGVRRPRRRPGRSPDEQALRNRFVTFFPGAQWVGDGTQLSLHINGVGHTFNLELDVDPASGALVGASVSDEEDSNAVIDAFDDGVETTGAAPLALLLDNRPSNLTDEVEKALGSTIRVRSTLGRAQNKGHVEGAFGLFQQAAPPLVITVDTERELARACLTLVVQMWGRTLNHRPRPKRGGKTRAELYQEAKPTPEDIERARAALDERRKIQEQADRTRRARQDPLVRALLDVAFVRLALLDPDGNIRAAIACYPRDAVLAGIATFEGKRAAGRLPPGVDGRYLLGIVRNISDEDEGVQIADALLRARLEARDHVLAGLQTALAAITGASPFPPQRIDAALDSALSSDRLIDRLFWLGAAANIIAAAETSARLELLQDAARRIHAYHRVPYADRLAAHRNLLARVVPVE